DTGMFRRRANGNVTEPFPACAFRSFEECATLARREEVRGNRDVLRSQCAPRSSHTRVQLQAGTGGIGDGVKGDHAVARLEVALQLRVWNARRDPDATLH